MPVGNEMFDDDRATGGLGDLVNRVRLGTNRPPAEPEAGLGMDGIETCRDAEGPETGEDVPKGAEVPQGLAVTSLDDPSQTVENPRWLVKLDDRGEVFGCHLLPDFRKLAVTMTMIVCGLEEDPARTLCGAGGQGVEVRPARAQSKRWVRAPWEDLEHAHVRILKEIVALDQEPAPIRELEERAKLPAAEPREETPLAEGVDLNADVFGDLDMDL